MWLSKENCDKKDKTNQLVAVAIDKDRGSQHALKWAIDNILHRSQTIALVHVKVKASHGPSSHIVLNGISHSLKLHYGYENILNLSS